MVTLTGTSGNDALTGKTGNDALFGMGGADTLNGGAGNDTMAGGTGDDVYIVDAVGDIVTENASEGIDTIRTTLLTYSLASLANVENLTYTGGGNATLTDNAANNLILGSSGNDTLSSTAGYDTLRGGGGNDVLMRDGDIDPPSGPTRTTFDGGAGTDTLVVSNSVVTQTAGGPAYIMHLTLGTLTSIEQLQFNSVASTVFQAIILPNQLAPTTTLIGGAGLDRLFVIAPTAGIYQLAPYTLSNWTTTTSAATSDLVSLIATAGNGDYTLKAAPTHMGIQQLVGQDGNDMLIGGSGTDVLVGGTGNDTMTPDDGSDTMTGGGGNDVFVIDGDGLKFITDFTIGADKIDLSQTGIDNFADLQPILSTSGGNSQITSFFNGVMTRYTIVGVTGLTASDFIFSTSTTPVFSTGSAGVDVLSGAGGNDSISALGGNDTLFGLNGNDTLDGGAGNDVMVGGLGNDTYIVDAVGDTVMENANEGTDIVRSATLTTLNLSSYANVENLSYTGSGNATLTGNSGDNFLSGGNGNDTIVGGGGIDTMRGGGGNDLLVQSGDIPIPSGGTMTFDGGSGFDTLSISNNVVTNGPNGSAYIVNLYNSSLSSIEKIQFNSNANTTFQAFIVAPQLGSGLAFNAELAGSAGYDKFFVIATTPGEFHLPSFTLTNWTTTADPLTSDVVGLVASTNAGDFTLYASSNHTGFQYVIGQEGNDSLRGGAGNEILIGNAGNDTIRPDDGTDTMTGGAGNDVFVLDGNGTKTITDFTIGQDKIDLTGTGFDTLASVQPYLSVVGGNTVLSATPQGIPTTYTLVGVTQALSSSDFIFSTRVEPTAHSGTSNSELINGGGGIDVIYGLGGNDTLNGFAGNDTLDGGIGNDRMVGGAGDDTYFVDSRNDVVVENANDGNDTIKTTLTSFGLTNLPNVENLVYTGASDAVLTGNSADNYLSGDTGADKLSGGLGADTLRGGLGNDTLTGGGGNDVFIFDTAPNASTNRETITDFVSGSDKLQFAHSVYVDLVNSPVGSDEFISGPGVIMATTNMQHFIYNTINGALYYDSDGAADTSPVLVAMLTGAPTLTAADIMVSGLV